MFVKLFIVFFFLLRRKSVLDFVKLFLCNHWYTTERTHSGLSIVFLYFRCHNHLLFIIELINNSLLDIHEIVHERKKVINTLMWTTEYLVFCFDIRNSTHTSSREYNWIVFMILINRTLKISINNSRCIHLITLITPLQTSIIGGIKNILITFRYFLWMTADFMLQYKRLTASKHTPSTLNVTCIMSISCASILHNTLFEYSRIFHINKVFDVFRRLFQYTEIYIVSIISFHILVWINTMNTKLRIILFRSVFRIKSVQHIEFVAVDIYIQ